MSHSYFTRKFLTIKDKNITFQEDYFEEVKLHSVTSFIFKGILSYQPTHCEHCGTLFDSKFKKHGFKTSRIVIPKVSLHDTYLDLKKQRYYCGHCQSTFTLKTSIVEKNCFISYHTKHAIALEAQNKISESDIARRHQVSHSTVNRIIHSFYESQSLNFNSLPENLCFDEFKSVKSAEGHMSFIFCDADTKQIIDIIEDRRLSSLQTYFKRYTKEARSRVKHIVIDMYAPYISLIKELFPHAKIVIDKFHLVQHISRALNKTRIRFMKQFKKHSRKFKRYWRLFLKSHTLINTTTYRSVYCFKQPMREIDILNFLLDLSPELKATYDLYQDLLFALQTKNLERFHHLLQAKYPLISPEFQTAFQTFKTYQSYIENTLTTSYTNAPIEGINNKIKVTKRIAFGYRSFYHWVTYHAEHVSSTSRVIKSRILMTQNLPKPKVKILAA